MKRQGWMTAEEWLALLLCRLQIHENIENEIRKVIENETVDTAKLQWICKEQRICPQLEYAILTTELSSLYTKEELIMTEKEHCLHDLRYLKYEQEISRIQSVLDTAGIRMVVFKGISYYGTIYPSRRQRVLGDIDFQIAWTMDAFILRWKPVGKIIWRCKNENYDAHLSHVMLRIGAVYEEEPLNILFQCCDGHLYPYMAPENNPWDHNGYVVPEIRCECNDRGIYTCYIPWSVLKFKAEHNQLLYIDLQARMVTVREQRYVDVCWQAGNCGCMWQEVRDCRFLTPAVLQ